MKTDTRTQAEKGRYAIQIRIHQDLLDELRKASKASGVPLAGLCNRALRALAGLPRQPVDPLDAILPIRLADLINE